VRDEEFELDLGGGERMAGEHRAGAAPGYLFLHGLGSTRTGQKSESLRDWAERRGRAFTRCDLRGHGSSTGSIGEVTISQLIGDTLLLLERLGATVVVGSSMGGLVGAFAAARRPELVPALALIAPAFGFLHRLERSVDAQGRLWTGEERSFRLDRRVIEDATRLDERTLPSRLVQPVLVVHGDRDEVVPHGRSRRFFAAIPHANKELWIVPGGDHRLNDVIGSVWPRLAALGG
jgi:pimeloyl-ACP methyl ester carboxylesterase